MTDPDLDTCVEMKLKDVKDKNLHREKDVYTKTFLGYRKVETIDDRWWVGDDKERSWALHPDKEVLVCD